MPGAQKRSGRREVEFIGDAQDEMPIDDDALRIPAVGDAAALFVRAVVSKRGAIVAELLEAFPTARALSTRVHHAADRGQIAFFEIVHAAAYSRHASDDLVARHARIRRAAPFTARGVQIGVTHAAEENVDLDIVRGRLAPLDGKRNQRRSRRLCGIGFGGGHDFTIARSSRR